jgi:fluoride ion exporter CrcB/FEX
MAVLGMIAAIAGFMASRKYLQKSKWVRMFCIIACGLLASICAVYIGLTFLFVNAVQSQPPV